MREPFAQVAIAAPIDAPLTYAVPPELDAAARPGCRVLAPLGGRRVTGYVVARAREAPPGVAVRPIEEVLDAEPILGAEMLGLAAWTAAYYFAPLGEVLRAMLPAGINVESRSVVVPGERQEAAVFGSPDRLTETERAAVAAARRAGEAGVPIAGFAKAAGVRVSLRTLYGLRRRGYIDLVPRVGRARATERTLWLIDVPPEVLADSGARVAELERRAPKQARLLGALAAMELPTTAEALRERVPDFAPALRELRRKGLVTARRAAADPFAEAAPPAEPDRRPTLTAEQAAALASIDEALGARAFASFLLHGVTGSGKTEVYLRAIERALALGRGALCLVPEIALTPQLVARFRARFGEACAVLHSGLAERDRLMQWLAIRRGRVRVALGVRSAIFAPLEDLGLVVVDEEHETSYKQESGVRYNARDLALVRAERAGAVVVLGSATPSLESYRNAERGKHRLFALRARVTGGPLPPVVVTNPSREKGSGPILGKVLEERLGACLAAGNQAILFLNRRGYAPALLCAQCGVAARCPNCSVALTYHARLDVLRCHYCEFGRDRPQACASCGAAKLHPLGVGTEKVESEVRRIFPEARVERMDRDATAKAGAFERLYHDFLARRIDVIVGTQMVVKGHHFPHVTLVGVVLADQSLHFPDFRAGERTFQLLTQVAGRAGRGDAPGEVVVQTYAPSHYAIRAACAHDYEALYRREIAERSELGYPPFERAALLRLTGPEEGAVKRAAGALARAAERWIGDLALPARAACLGPAPAPLVRIQGRYRYQLFLKSPSSRTLHDLVGALLARKELYGPVAPEVDVDPYGM